MTDNQDFPRLVSLACHDLRTPLATVYGFARTLARTEELGEPVSRYVSMIEAASTQLGALLDDLGLAARIESGRYEPVFQERDTLELATAAAGRAGDKVSASGDGAGIETDAEPVERALAALALAAQRHGAVDEVAIAVDGLTIGIAPVTAAAAPVVLARDLKDLGAAVALRLLAALGAEVALDGTALTVRFDGK
jgi:signal transduction histidine kinase